MMSLLIRVQSRGLANLLFSSEEEGCSYVKRYTVSREHRGVCARREQDCKPLLCVLYVVH